MTKPRSKARPTLFPKTTTSSLGNLADRVDNADPDATCLGGDAAGAPLPDSAKTSPLPAIDKTGVLGETSAMPGLGSAASLRRRLVERMVIADADWESAVAAVGDPNNVMKILDQLQRTPASWDVGTGEAYPALTPFQTEQILEGNVDRLRLDHYVVLERLGAGGMGEVFKARNLNLPRLEAIKTILNEESELGTAGKSQDLERFQREARLLSQLDHRHITTIHHAGRDHGLNFIAMEYVNGQDLRQIVELAKERGENVPIWWAVERIIEVADALKHAHENGVVHRDIKPQNIMITAKDTLKVLDMGIARLANAEGGPQLPRLTQDGTGLGTPDVMPPEQWADAASVTPASDIYSLGCTFYFLLTGEMPFIADSINGLMFCHFNDPRPEASSVRFDVPKKLDEIIRHMMAKDVDERFTDCKDVIEALKPFAEKEPKPKAPAPKPEPAPHGSMLKWIATGVVGLGLLAGTFLAVKTLTDRGEPAPSTPTEIAKQSPAKQKRPEPKPAQKEPTADEAAAQAAKKAAEKKAATERVRRGEMKSKVFEALIDWQRTSPDVWKDVAGLQEWVHAKFPLDSITDDSVMNAIREAVQTETFRRRARLWIETEFSRTTLAWKSQDKLNAWFEQEFPDGVTDLELFEKMQQDVRAETQKRINIEKDAWIADRLRTESDLELSRNEFTDAAFGFDSADQVSDDASFQRWTGEVIALTEALRQPFEELDYKPLGNEVEDWRNTSVLHTYEWVAGLDQAKRDLTAEIDVQVLIDKKPIESNKVPVNTKFDLAVLPKKSGYLSILIFQMNAQQQVILRFPDRLSAGMSSSLSDLEATKEDTDVYVFLLTSVSAHDGAPAPPAELLKLKSLEESPYVIRRTSDDLKPIIAAFKHRLVYDRMFVHLRGGLPLSGVPTARNVQWWNTKVLDIRIIDPQKQQN